MIILAQAPGFKPWAYGFGENNKAIHKLHRSQVFIFIAVSETIGFSGSNIAMTN